MDVACSSTNHFPNNGCPYITFEQNPIGDVTVKDWRCFNP